MLRALQAVALPLPAGHAQGRFSDDGVLGGLHGAVAARRRSRDPVRHARGSQDGPQGQDRRAARPRRARVHGRSKRRARDAAYRAVCSRRGRSRSPTSRRSESRSPRATRPSRWTRTVSTTAPRPSRSSGASSSCGARRAPTRGSIPSRPRSRRASSRGRRGRG